MQVYTIKGLVDRDQLTVKDIVNEGANDRSVVTEWYLGEELVRRDVHVMILRPIGMDGNAGDFK